MGCSGGQETRCTLHSAPHAEHSRGPRNTRHGDRTPLDAFREPRTSRESWTAVVAVAYDLIDPGGLTGINTPIHVSGIRCSPLIAFRPRSDPHAIG
ncbi:hypothetical protein EYF80_040274 [Liparis tanakae]|uniref:Uncharacterized protein n=1 Tax=Liparis tanakae TaxID=230148 RepID=A0A4Z2G9K4_9TELE|nr:hypothetical protein EYF80_040274 [Liparis tanakae]